MNKPRRLPQGFTLMELFITVFVLISTFTAFVTLFYALNNYSQKSYRLLAASDIAYNKLQSYQQKQFSHIPFGDATKNYTVEDFSSELSDTIGPGSIATVSVVPIGDDAHVKKIDVTVSYQEGGTMRDVQYAAIVNSLEYR